MKPLLLLAQALLAALEMPAIVQAHLDASLQHWYNLKHSHTKSKADRDLVTTIRIKVSGMERENGKE